jgi:hypothetical protein
LQTVGRTLQTGGINTMENKQHQITKLEAH